MIEVDEQKMDWYPGMTVENLLEESDQGRFCSVVRLNGKLVSSPQFKKTRIPDNAVIRLLPLVAGG